MTNEIGEFSIQSHGGLGLVDLDAYISFRREEPTLREVDIHFRDQMRLGSLLIWDSNSGEDEYHLRVRKGYSTERGFREAWGWITASTGRLYIASEDTLSWAAGRKDDVLPDEFEADLNFLIDPGHYRARIIQMYDPRDHNEPSIPAFVIELGEGIGPTWGAAAWSREMWWHSHCIYEYSLPPPRPGGSLIRGSN